MLRRDRRLLAVGCVLAVALLVGLFVAAGRPFAVRLLARAAPEVEPQKPSAAAADAGDHDATRARAAAARLPPAVKDGGDAKPLPENVSALALARTTANDYRQRARYPRWSQPLGEGEDPILRDRQVSPVTGAGPGGAEPTLTVFPDQVSFQSPQAVLLYAHLSVGGQRVPADSISGIVVTEDQQPIGEVEYRDDGRAGDQMGGDYLYTAQLRIDPKRAPAATASYLVKVRAITVEQQERLAAGGFLYSAPDAELTGTYRDRRDSGDLLIEAEIAATDSGRFHIEATLYSADGRTPIAWAQHAAELPAGRHRLPLRFHGLIMREHQVDGPYLLRFVALSTATQMPNAKNTLVENAHRTSSYAAADFSGEPFNDPDLLEAADRIERALEGVAPEVEG